VINSSRVYTVHNKISYGNICFIIIKMVTMLDHTTTEVKDKLPGDRS